jgi:SAM-dependent methyltransferase
VVLVARPVKDHPGTSHERSSGRSWEDSYRDLRPAPWDIGRPQDAFVRVASEGAFSGAVLDAGCGTGEHALLAASLGHRALGVDIAATAIDLARAKAADRGIAAEFAVADAFELDRLGRTFETALDCGLFHTCDGEERPRYVASLASATAPGGTLYLLCFSDDAPDIGPHPIRQDELRTAFGHSSGWDVVAIEPERIQTTFMEVGVPGWFATITRI